MEEPSDLSNSGAAVHPKHAAMLRRLSHRTNPNPSSSSDDTFESTPHFLSLFSQSKLSIQSSLSSAASSSDAAVVSAAIDNLAHLVATSSSFLPTYELRSCLSTISSLRKSLLSLSSRIGPKPTFSFKTKKPITAHKPVSDTHFSESPKSAFSVPESSNDEIFSKEFSGSEIGEFVLSGLDSCEPITACKPVSDTHFSESPKSTFSVPESPGFHDAKDEVFSKAFSGSEIGEFVLSGLDSCEARLKGRLQALFVNKLRKCRVYSGPVSGSVLIEEVEDCVFVLASHQIRIHNAKRCDFYLRVRSRPIIEDCEGVRFAPYCLGYEGIERDLGEVKLDEENENWGNVDDFKWLKGFQSPNWSVLPGSERISKVTILGD